MNAADLETIAWHSGYHLATVKTYEERETCLAMLRKIKTAFYLKDRYFSIENFDNRILEVEDNLKRRIAAGETLRSITATVKATVGKTSNGNARRRSPKGHTGIKAKGPRR